MWANAQRDGRPPCGALCSTQFGGRPLLECRSVTLPKTRNPLKLAGVPQTNETIWAASGPKFTILCGHVEEILLLNKFFSDCRYMPLLRWYSSTKLWVGAQMATFLGPVFAASRVQHLSDLHSKFALGPHHVSKYGRHPTVGCHYFPPGLRLPPQPQSITALWPVPSYTAW